MHIPRYWIRESTTDKVADGWPEPLSAWGWGSDESSARQSAMERLDRIVQRLRRGEDFPGPYEYSQRPLREEILETIADEQSGAAAAIITRNKYGAEVLNTADLLFLDIDFEPQGLMKRLFGKGKSPEQTTLEKLRDVLSRQATASFRVYRTASGLRAMAVDQRFDPRAEETQKLMRVSGTDRAYARMCRAQQSFRARLTPKPWRCNCALPPGQHPRLQSAVKRGFAQWLGEYSAAASGFATCRYLETIGTAKSSPATKLLVDLHDRLTRADESLPLA